LFFFSSIFFLSLFRQRWLRWRRMPGGRVRDSAVHSSRRMLPGLRGSVSLLI
jgi:hypothetical protein